LNYFVISQFVKLTEYNKGELCQKLGVDRYPSIFFFGYGNFNQGAQGSIIGRTQYPAVARFVSELYVEAVYDWIRMLSFMSFMSRTWDDIIGFFTGNSRKNRKIYRLEEENTKLRERVDLFSEALQIYKANEIFDKLENKGDPYPLLNQLEPDEVRIWTLIYIPHVSINSF
jgi:hypothetical protein